MTRYDGPVRFRFRGDPELARQYMHIGRKALGEVHEAMERGGLQQLSRIVRTQNGVYITVYSGFGEEVIDITKEGGGEEEDLLGGDFVTIPASDEASLGWGAPFFDGEGNPINPPLGTPNGGFPQTLLNWTDSWKASRYPEYSFQWPTGLEYGNNSWAGKDPVYGDVVLSWKSDQRYRDWGFIFKTKVIYAEGFPLCNTKEYVIGAAVINGNLVALSATREASSGRSAIWHFRPFRREGYLNDDDYDPNTNPNGWRQCFGDPQETFAREDARQPTIFAPDGLKAAGSYVTSRPTYNESSDDRKFVFDINVVTYAFSASPGQVTVTRIRELNPYESGYQNYPSLFTHVWKEPPDPDPGEEDTSTTPGATFDTPVYSEFDGAGNLSECQVSSGRGDFYLFDRSPPDVFGKYIEDGDVESYARFSKALIESYFLDSRREEFDGVQVGDNHFTLRQVAIVDGNLSTGYFLLLTREESPRNSYTTTLSVVGPGVNSQLFSSPNNLSYPYFATSINIYNPAHLYYADDYSDMTEFDVSDQATGLAKATGFPDFGVDAGFSYYFAAHRNPNNQVIVTAWARWERGEETLFGAYNFITDGDLSGLTKVQGTNQRHNNTGVI